MNKEDQTMKATLQRAQRQADGRAPEFGSLFAAAERRTERRRTVRFAGLAAAMAVAAIALGLLPVHEEEFRYVDVEELVATTQWSAPSDFLLPTHRFDLYQELPQLFESTNTDEGALL